MVAVWRRFVLAGNPDRIGLGLRIKLKRRPRPTPETAAVGPFISEKRSHTRSNDGGLQIAVRLTDTLGIAIAVMCACNALSPSARRGRTPFSGVAGLKPATKNHFGI